MLSVIGLILLIFGFSLLPFLIGLPLMFAGWLLLLFDFFRSWYRRLIPSAVQQKVAHQLNIEYLPYQPAIKSMKVVLIDIAKVTTLVFISGVMLILLGLKVGWW